MADKKQQIIDDVDQGDDHDHDNVLWGKAFRWEIRGVSSVEEVWRITGDFVRVDAWVTSLLQSSELVEGQVNQPGCVRKLTMYPSAPGQPSAFAFEKLLLIDPPAHTLQYTLLPGAILPVFSLMDGYLSTLRLIDSPPPPHDDAYDDHNAGPPPPSSTCILHWSFTCKPSASLTQEQAIDAAFSLYNAAVNDLKPHLSLPDDSVTLLD